MGVGEISRRLQIALSHFSNTLLRMVLWSAQVGRRVPEEADWVEALTRSDDEGPGEWRAARHQHSEAGSHRSSLGRFGASAQGSIRLSSNKASAGKGQSHRRSQSPNSQAWREDRRGEGSDGDDSSASSNSSDWSTMGHKTGWLRDGSVSGGAAEFVRSRTRGLAACSLCTVLQNARESARQTTEGSKGWATETPLQRTPIGAADVMDGPAEEMRPSQSYASQRNLRLGTCEGEGKASGRPRVVHR